MTRTLKGRGCRPASWRVGAVTASTYGRRMRAATRRAFAPQQLHSYGPEEIVGDTWLDEELVTACLRRAAPGGEACARQDDDRDIVRPCIGPQPAHRF